MSKIDKREVEIIDLKLDGKVLFTISHNMYTDEYICYKITDKGKEKVCKGDNPLDLEEQCGYKAMYTKLMKKKLKEEKDNGSN